MYKVVSLFSGCGGLDLGFKGGFDFLGNHYDKNKFDIIWANDYFVQACDTYAKNISNHIYQGKIEDVLDNKSTTIPSEADVVIGGFPCQDFSVAGKRGGITVKRGKLYLQMKRVIEHIKPKMFIAENVEGLVNMEKGIVLDTIKNDLSRVSDGDEEVKYTVSHHLLHAADYGVPQIRKRVFIVGIREDIQTEFTIPLPTHEGNWISSTEAIDDLWGKENDPSIFNHSQVSRAKFYPGRKMQGNVQIKADAPSFTIRAEHHGNIEAHYRSTNENKPEDMSYWRRLTVRECARIQSFPDDFEFMGAGTYTYKQVGNAVPPVLAWHVANSVQNVLLANDKSTLKNKKELITQI